MSNTAETKSATLGRGEPHDSKEESASFGGLSSSTGPRTNKDLIPIYTDWANHYLEKCQKKRLIQDLQKDMQDSLLLIDVVESVTGEKVPEVKLKPKNAAQVVENIGCCIRFVESLGVNVDGLTAKDIRDGQLKAILGLFFGLSRYKQIQKSLNSAVKTQQAESAKVTCALSSGIPVAAAVHMSSVGPTSDPSGVSRLPSPFKVASPAANAVANSGSAAASGSAIPSLSTTPTRALNPKSNEPTASDRTKTQLAVGATLTGSSKKNGSSQSDLRPSKKLTTSSNSNKNSAPTGIPTPGPATPGGLKSSAPSTSGLRPPTTGGSTNRLNSPSTNRVKTVEEKGHQGKMLEKFKLFGGNGGSKEKNQQKSGPIPKSATRASNSSSGFSSAKSEASTTVATSSVEGQNQGVTPSPKGLRAFGKKGMKSPKTPTKNAAKSAKYVALESEKPPSTEPKVSPQPVRKRPPGKEQATMVVATPPKASRDSGVTGDWSDVDSAYAGFDSSSSPSSSNAPSDDSKLYAPPSTSKCEGRKSPVGAASPAKLTSPTGLKSPMSTSASKPTLAVKGVAISSPGATAPSSSLAATKPPHAPKPTAMTKPNSLVAQARVQGGAGIKASASNMDRVGGGASSGSTGLKTPRSQSSALLKQQSQTGSSKDATGSGVPGTTNDGSMGAGVSSVPVSSPTVGVVSPMTHHKPAPVVPTGSDAPTGRTSDSPGPDRGVQSDSNSSQTSRSRDSDAASVIYCPASEPSGSEKPDRPDRQQTGEGLLREKRAARSGSSRASSRTSSRLETTFDTSDGVVTQTLQEPSGAKPEEGAAESVEPMEPLIPRASPFVYFKTLGNVHAMGGTPLRLVPDSALAGKKPHLTPNRPLGSLLKTSGDAGDETVLDETGIRVAAGEISVGYVSDGDALLAGPGTLAGPLADLSAADLTSGYMSEGGITLYARRMQEKFKEGLEAVRDSMKRGDPMNDSFEDSSSLSSGLSENIDELSTDDLTGSSLSDHQAAAFHNHNHHNWPAAQSRAAAAHLLQRQQRALAAKRADNGQQTEVKQHEHAVRDSMSALQQRKLSEQESIDQLLQKCRTSARGLGSPALGGGRPKSEQMNGGLAYQQQQGARGPAGPMGNGTFNHSHTLDTGRGVKNGNSVTVPRLQLGEEGGQSPRLMSSAGGTAVSTAGGNAIPHSSPGYRGRTPLTTNTLKLLRQEQQQLQQALLHNPAASASSMDQSGPYVMNRPGSAQGGSLLGPNGSLIKQNNAYAAGYHSLDRKRHLMGYCSESDALATAYGASGGAYNGQAVTAATLAMVSPKRMVGNSNPANKASLSLPVSHEGPIPPDEEAIAAAWTRHTGASPLNGAAPRHAAGPTGCLAMSKSMIEQSNSKQQQQKLKLVEPSAKDTMSFETEKLDNGHVVAAAKDQLQRNLAPPTPARSPNTKLNGMRHNGPTPSRMPLPKGGHHNSEGVYANLIQRTCTAAGSTQQDPSSPTSQLSLHKFTSEMQTGVRSPTSLSVGAKTYGAGGASPYLSTMLNKAAGATDDGAHHGSSLSLASATASFYGTEDKYRVEIERLQRRLETQSREREAFGRERQVYADTVQALSARSHTQTSMVSAFERSLQGVTRRFETLQQQKTEQAAGDRVEAVSARSYTQTSMVSAFERLLQGVTRRFETLQQQKTKQETELMELKRIIVVLREMCVASGINVDEIIRSGSPAIHRRHTFTDSQNGGLARQPSVESVVSTVSHRSSLSTSSKASASNGAPQAPGTPKPKKSWAPSMDAFQIRSSFTRAFSKNKKPKVGCSASDAEETSTRDAAGGASTPCTPRHASRDPLKPANSVSALSNVDQESMVSVLRAELAEKNSALADIRLEALSKASEVDQLREKLAHIKNEKGKLERMVSESSRAGSHSSLPLISDADSVSEYGGQTMSDVVISAGPSTEQRDMRRLMVSVRLDLSGDVPLDPAGPDDSSEEILIGCISIGARTSWDRLDADLAKLFSEYLHKIDPVASLNLSHAGSVLGYRLGSSYRDRQESLLPKELPSKCVAEDANHRTSHSLQLVLKGVKQGAADALAFETLVPRANLERLITQLTEQHRLILCGSQGIGKAHVARRLAEYLALRAGRNVDEAVDVIQLEEERPSRAELKNRLQELMRQYRDPALAKQAPTVVIIDNLQHISSFSDIFAVLSSDAPQGCKGQESAWKGPHIIGTINQSTKITNLQIEHNFRFVLWANHVEPVRGYLGRYLRRRLIQDECRRGCRCSPDMNRVIDWLPKVWQHLNKYIEAVNSKDATVGPRLFFSCPLSLDESRDWFVDLWNSKIHPYLLQATQEGMMFGKGRGSLEDPRDFVCGEWPWPRSQPDSPTSLPDEMLAKLSLEDLDSSEGFQSTPRLDPLLMLVRIREQESQNEELMAESTI